jgi:hypothetical protein
VIVLQYFVNVGPRSALIEVPEETSAAEVHQPVSWHSSQQPQSLSEQPLFEAQQSLLGGGEPPPYHIAIWLPQPEGEAEAPTDPQQPPPSYDNATS